MKIIDLLNKIANGEEVPKKIKYENRILYLEDEAEEYEPTFNYYDKDGENALFEGWIGQYLNDEVEIIKEEKKIPEKLEDRARFQYSEIPTWLEKKEIIKAINENFEKHQKAIYEIIDHLKSKGE